MNKLILIILLAGSIPAFAETDVDCDQLKIDNKTFSLGMTKEEFQCFHPRKMNLETEGYKDGKHRELYMYRKMIGKVYVAFEDDVIYYIHGKH
jgi:hypothetical protein